MVLMIYNADPAQIETVAYRAQISRDIIFDLWKFGWNGINSYWYVIYTIETEIETVVFHA
jgi:hypothetical protein